MSFLAAHHSAHLCPPQALPLGLGLGLGLPALLGAAAAAALLSRRRKGAPSDASVGSAKIAGLDLLPGDGLREILTSSSRTALEQGPSNIITMWQARGAGCTGLGAAVGLWG